MRILQKSKSYLNSLNRSNINATLQLPNGTKFKVVKYVPPEKLTDGNLSCLKSVEESSRIESVPHQQQKRKYSLTVKPQSQNMMMNEDKPSKWLKTNEMKKQAPQREKVYKFNYLSSFKEIREDQKWAQESRVKIFGEDVTTPKTEEESDALEVKMDILKAIISWKINSDQSFIDLPIILQDSNLF